MDKHNTCAHCGKQLPTHASSSQLYCNTICKNRAKHARRRHCDIHRPRYKERTCFVCHESYLPSYRDQRTCSRDCGDILRAFNAGTYVYHWRTILRWQACKHCGTKYVMSPRMRSEYCSSSCKWKADHRQTLTCARCQGPRPLYKTYCDECARELMREARRKCKHNSTGSHRRRARHYGVPYETVNSAVVYERDNWICHICGEPIDRTVKYPHPRSKSIDHVLPLSKGGSHSYNNIKAAHFWCNSMKSDHIIDPLDNEATQCAVPLD